MTRYDIAVVGAGAAGLMAGIAAGRAGRGRRVGVFDGAQKIGAKILISGGGRCNVTHHQVTAADFNGNRNTIGRILRTFTVPQTIEFFRAIGVELKREETGKLFPVTDSARTVLDALLGAAGDSGVEIVPATRIEQVIRAGSEFILENRGSRIEAGRVILATGGRSIPKTGSDGRGYEIARALGHTVSEVFPALVPLVIEEPHWIRELSGTSADVELSLRSDSGRVLHRERGSMLMTHFGISGPVALDISRHWIAARRAGRPTLSASFLPDEGFESLEARLLRAARQNPQATVTSALRGSLPERVLERVAPPGPISRLRRDERREAVRLLIELPIPVSRDRGFDYAEVTAGGVPLEEIDPATMASRRSPGLFLCGEILDVDGRIGGFNFQWAWATGRLAGQHCAGFA